MERLTISLTDEQYEALVNEAEQRGVSKSRVVREVFARWCGSSRDSRGERPSGEAVASSGGEEDANCSEEVMNRLTELEARVDDLESGGATGSGPDPPGVSTAEHDEEARNDDSGEPDGGGAEATISTGRSARTRGEAEQQPDPRPPDDDLRERAVWAFRQAGVDADAEYADALAAVLEYAREHGSVSMREALENVMLAGYAADYETAPAREYLDSDRDRDRFQGAWWRNMTEAFEELPEIEEPVRGASTWRWVGEEESGV